MSYKKSVCKFDEITHIIIDTGYAPSVAKMLAIENAIRHDTGNDVTCIFACDSVWHMGVLIANPYGFHIPKELRSKCDDIEKFRRIKTIRENLIKQNNIPYCDYALKNLDKKLKSAATQDLTNEDTYYELLEVALQPVTPEKEYTYDIFMTESFDEGIINEFQSSEAYLSKNDSPVMSFNERLVETWKIMGTLGEPKDVDGMLCIKVKNDNYNRVNPLKIQQIISKEDLTYCASFDIERTEYIETPNANIFIIGYDAEHG